MVSLLPPEEELEPLEMAPPCMGLLCFQWFAWKLGCLNLDEKKDPVQLNRGESIDVRELAKTPYIYKD